MDSPENPQTQIPPKSPTQPQNVLQTLGKTLRGEQNITNAEVPIFDSIEEYYRKKCDETNTCQYPNVDPNKMARLLSELVWFFFKRNGDFTAVWILFANYFFSVLPGIVSLWIYVKLYQSTNITSTPTSTPTSTSTSTSTPPSYSIRSLKTFANICSFLIVLYPLFITLFQMFFFNRLFFLKITQYVLLGQLVSLLFYSLQFSNGPLQFLNNLKTWWIMIPSGMVAVMGFVVCWYRNKNDNFQKIILGLSLLFVLISISLLVFKEFGLLQKMGINIKEQTKKEIEILYFISLFALLFFGLFICSGQSIATQKFDFTCPTTPWQNVKSCLVD